MKYLLFLLFFFILYLNSIAQVDNKSKAFYSKIEKKANSNKFSKLIYKSVFENPNGEDSSGPSFIINKKLYNPYLKYKGKTIRKIKIIVIDPFGYSVNKFYGENPDYFENLGNKLHISTKDEIIKNLLLFQTLEALDPLKIMESERLLRLSPYVFDARIYITENLFLKQDSVDLIVLVQDRWSITLNSNFNPVLPNVNLIEKNFLGIGHQYTQGFEYNIEQQKLYTSGKYSIFNLRKTFISASIYYSTIVNNRNLGLNLERPFYSTLSKWAGGVKVEKNENVYETFNQENIVIKTYPLNNIIYDFWMARNIRFRKKINIVNESRNINFIVGARYFNQNYYERPSFLVDTLELFRDQTLLLSNFGFSERNYYRDRYLFRFGANEDIPTGISIEFVFGTLTKEFSKSNLYYGLKFRAGKHFEKFGYISNSTSYGTFVKKNFAYSGVVNFDIFYFTDLIRMNKWYFRQLTRFKIIQGLDRPINENINLNGQQLYGFQSTPLLGKSKIILNFEFIFYAPIKIIGFQFAPVLFCGLGSIGKDFFLIRNNPIYQSYALGILIRNEYLISNTFQVSIGLYPYMPGNPDYLLKINPIANYEIKAQDYFNAKPELVPYE